MKLLKAMAIAFSIYSKIPVPQFEWKEEDMEYMMCFFPWIGGVIGLFFFGWAVLCEKFAVGNVCYALIGAAIPLMISGGFHVDGYMDTMDAFHSYQSREKKLEILKDSHIGAFAAAMNGVDAIVFTAGLGENHVIVRQRVCESLKYLGVTPDINLNEKMTRGNEGKITTENSTVDVYVIPTNEELVIARDTRSILEAMQYANL